jgi:23S rRNA U2552 (ribose-2'-O)-methylase RlmE/FtsJ
MDYSSIELWGYGGPPSVPVELAASDTVTKSNSVCYTPESRALQQCKNEIDQFYQEGKWDDYKKITNPYEYIFLSWNRRSSRSVTLRQPLSRSYYKMIELWQRLELDSYLIPFVRRDGGLITAHAAEGPGGFIEACAVRAEKHAWALKSVYGITLRSEAKNVPGWRKTAKFLTTYPQVHIHDGADGTGNILLRGNQDAFVYDVRAAHPSGVHIYTADGGFDFSGDFSAQEDSVFPLLLAEALLGLRVLAKGGCLIIKCFDTTEQPTFDLLWLISRAFLSWGIVKPRTSRAGNAERYIVGRGFLGGVEDILDVLHRYQEAGVFTAPILKGAPCESAKKMMTDLMDFQTRVEHLELAVIRDTLDLIQTTDISQIRRLVRDNVQRSIVWCTEHDEPISPSWLSEQEKLVSKETADLLHILNPPSNVVSYSNPPTYYRSTNTHMLSFTGFRSGTMVPMLKMSDVVNPFMRTGTKQ